MRADSRQIFNDQRRDYRGANDELASNLTPVHYADGRMNSNSDKPGTSAFCLCLAQSESPRHIESVNTYSSRTEYVTMKLQHQNTHRR